MSGKQRSSFLIFCSGNCVDLLLLSKLILVLNQILKEKNRNLGKFELWFGTWRRIIIYDFVILLLLPLFGSPVSSAEHFLRLRNVDVT